MEHYSAIKSTDRCHNRDDYVKGKMPVIRFHGYAMFRISKSIGTEAILVFAYSWEFKEKE